MLPFHPRSSDTAITDTSRFWESNSATWPLGAWGFVWSSAPRSGMATIPFMDVLVQFSRMRNWHGLWVCGLPHSGVRVSVHLNSVPSSSKEKNWIRWFSRSATAMRFERGSYVMPWQLWNLPLVLPFPPKVRFCQIPSREKTYTFELP